MATIDLTTTCGLCLATPADTVALHIAVLQCLFIMLDVSVLMEQRNDRSVLSGNNLVTVACTLTA